MKKLPTAVFAKDLVALRSICQAGRGRAGQVLLRDGRSLLDPRRVSSLVEALARHFAVDLVALRQRCGQFLHRRNFLPLPLAADMVLVPLALGRCGERTGYVNLLSVKAASPMDKFSKVEVEGGRVLETEISLATVHNRFVQAQLALRELEVRGMGFHDQGLQQRLELIRALTER